MRVLVCGGRDFGDFPFLYEWLDAFHAHYVIEVLIHGEARGADRLAGFWAKDRGIAVQGFRADWEAHGRHAGPIRNRLMLDEGKPDVVVAFKGGNGTRHMARIAREAGIHVEYPGDWL